MKQKAPAACLRSASVGRRWRAFVFYSDFHSKDEYGQLV